MVEQKRGKSKAAARVQKRISSAVEKVYIANRNKNGLLLEYLAEFECDKQSKYKLYVFLECDKGKERKMITFRNGCEMLVVIRVKSACSACLLQETEKESVNF